MRRRGAIHIRHLTILNTTPYRHTVVCMRRRGAIHIRHLTILNVTHHPVKIQGIVSNTGNPSPTVINPRQTPSHCLV